MNDILPNGRHVEFALDEYLNEFQPTMPEPAQPPARDPEGAQS
jgi:hypothetical protein